MEHGFQDRPQISADNLLGDAVRDRGNCPTVASRRSPWGYPPGAPAAACSCLTTVGSRACRGWRRAEPRSPGSTAHLLQPLPGWPSHVGRPPILPASRWKTASPASCGSSRHRLAAAEGRTPQPLWSSAVAAPSTLIRAVLPLCPASVLWAWQGSPARPSPLASGRQVLLFRVRA
jgi:hypothetical protein